MGKEPSVTDQLSSLTGPLSDCEKEEALISEAIYVWGPDGERFERMFDVVMKSRIAALKAET